MNLKPEEQKTAQGAINFVLKNKSKIFEELGLKSYAKDKNYPVTSLFTAGIPGAGKTEYAEYLVDWYQQNKEIKLLHIDIDRYRNLIPAYNGKNSYVVQDAAAKIVDKVFDYAHHKQLNYIMDTTFAAPKTIESVNRAIKRKRVIVIDFIYLQPEQAWLNTQARAIDEGRYVPKEVFIEAYYNSVENIRIIKNKHKENIDLNIIIKEENVKDLQITLKKLKLNVENIDDHIPEMYTKEVLGDILSNHDIKKTLNN